MRIVALVGGVLTAVVLGVVVLLLGTGSTTAAGTATTAVAAERPTGPPEDERGPDGRKPDADRGAGRPAWAGAGKPDDAWKQAWRAMTPAERRRTMTGLAREHRDGMRAWQECRRDGGGDTDCEKPLPPGQAKKQLAG